MSLESLPDDVLIKIVEELPFTEIIRWKLVNKQLGQVFSRKAILLQTFLKTKVVKMRKELKDAMEEDVIVSRKIILKTQNENWALEAEIKKMDLTLLDLKFLLADATPGNDQESEFNIKLIEGMWATTTPKKLVSIKENEGRSTIYFRDWSACNLSGKNLNKASLENTVLTNANLAGASLIEADLSRVILEKANLENANLAGACLKNANLKGANLKGANLRGADLTDADLTNADLTGADLTNAKLPKAILNSTKLVKAKLFNANLRQAIVTNADLTEAILTEATLDHAEFTDVELVKADLGGVNLSSVTFKGTNNFSEASLKNAKMQSSSLNNVDLTNADLRGVLSAKEYLCKAKSLAGAKFAKEDIKLLNPEAFEEFKKLVVQHEKNLFSKLQDNKNSLLKHISEMIDNKEHLLKLKRENTSNGEYAETTSYLEVVRYWQYELYCLHHQSRLKFEAGDEDLLKKIYSVNTSAVIGGSEKSNVVTRFWNGTLDTSKKEREEWVTKMLSSIKADNNNDNVTHASNTSNSSNSSNSPTPGGGP